MSTTPDSGEEQPDSERGERYTARQEQREGSLQPEVMIPRRDRRLPLEAPLMRLVATAGVIAIGVVISAIMTSQHSKGWVIGLVVAIVSVVLAAVLWSSRGL
jgi:hypothetical protein